MAVKLFRIKISNWIFSNTEDFQIFYGLQLWYDSYHMSLELWILQKSNMNDFNERKQPIIAWNQWTGQSFKSISIDV